jgi:Kef-type K+ transport system membrane component KefB
MVDSSVYPAMLFLGGMMFSMVLYLGEKLEWYLTVIGGMLSSLFLFSLGFYWIGANPLPEMGWLFTIWGTMNLLISIVVMFTGFTTRNQGRFEGRGRFDT